MFYASDKVGLLFEYNERIRNLYKGDDSFRKFEYGNQSVCLCVCLSVCVSECSIKQNELIGKLSRSFFFALVQNTYT